MIQNTKELLSLMQLERIREDIFRGKSHDISLRNVFGGQVLSQALHAAMLTVPEERILHSMHAYFILPGDLKETITFEVDRVRNGGSFSTRAVVAMQKGKAIFNIFASFQAKEEGLTHKITMPNVIFPENLSNNEKIAHSYVNKLPERLYNSIQNFPIELRPVERINLISRENHPPSRHIWIRAKGDVPDHLGLNQRLLAYASDYNLLATSMLPHRDKIVFGKIQVASLDHAMWFHRSFNMGDWLLYAIDSPSASNARGFTRGNIFSREGVLVASVAQEGLIRRIIR